MSVPVISPTTSIIDYPMGETWLFQPAASNSPTSWTWLGLPPGINFNATTGVIGGTCLTRGFYVATVHATNNDGDSAAVEMPISIYAGAWNATPATEIQITAATGVIAAPSSFAINAKVDTDLFYDILFVDGAGAGLLLNMFDLRLSITSKLNGEVILETDGSWISGGDVDSRHYRLILRFRGDALSSMFAASEDGATEFEGEIQFTHTVIINGIQYPIRQITPTFPCTINPKLLIDYAG